MSKKKPSLAVKIFIGLTAGLAAGLLLMGFPNGVSFADRYIRPFGTIFLNLLKFVVVPIVLLSITSGVISLRDVKKVGAIGAKAVAFYTCTTAFAVILSLFLAAGARGLGLFRRIQTSGLEYTPPEGQSLMDTLVSVFPSNPITPLADAVMLQVIVIALFLGFGILLAGDKGRTAAVVLGSLNEVFMKIMDLIIALSPFGVACLLAPVVAENGSSVLKDFAAVLLVAYLGYLLHALIVYSMTVRALGRVSPSTFFKGMAPAMMMAFSSASSVGTLPLTMECSENLGARREVTSFVLPLGATLNMDGTAIYQGVCAVFIASAYGIDLTLGQMTSVVLTATLASIGTAGVPGSGMIMLAMVLQSAGLPVEGIALVAGIDRLFDMGRTAVNITGDAACAVIISKTENKK